MNQMSKKLLKKVRVRFAPSPTGALHLGSLRTALYNYLFARKNQGSFVLRIEDTDTERLVTESESYISQVLEWCGIRPDESPFFGGNYGPYRQSERKYIYISHVTQLIKKGFAYYAFDTNETLESIRNEFQKNGEKFIYNSRIREKMENSLSLPYKEVHRRLEKPYVVRFKTPYKNECLEIYDEVRGKIHINTSTLDDKILLKSDGMPTYHLANVIDDHLMHISHVIRGEEWLPSMAFHCLLYRSFGWEIPKFVHLPLILNPRGKGKLSKRDKGKLELPIFPIQWRDPETGIVIRGYREYGYFPEAIINMLAFLGWNPGGVEEFFLMNDLVRKFSLEKVGKSSVYLSIEKARWFNHQHLQKKTLYEISALFRKDLEKHKIKSDENYIRKVIESVRKRVCFIHEIWEQSSYFFIYPKNYDKCYLQKIRSSRYCLKSLKKLLESVEDFKEDSLKIKIKDFSKQHNISSVFLKKNLRLALVGSLQGVGIFLLMEMIGKRETLNRVECFSRALHDSV